MANNRLPSGWTEKDVQAVAKHYEEQRAGDAISEDEAAPTCYVEVPFALLPAIRQLLAAYRTPGVQDEQQAIAQRIDDAERSEFIRLWRGVSSALPARRSSPPKRPADRKALKQAIQHDLTRAERLVVVFRYFENMEATEIAAATNQDVGAVSKLLESALRKLRARIAA